MSTVLSKKQMTEEDIKLNYITPAIMKGWKGHITMETKITDGRINIRGNIVARSKPKFVDYMLYLNDGKPMDCQHFFRQIFLGYFSDIVQAFDTLRKNVCGDDYTSLHNPIVLSSVLPAYGMFHSIQILFL